MPAAGRLASWDSRRQRNTVRRTLAVVTSQDCKGCGACCRHMGRPDFFRTGPRTGWEGYPPTEDDAIWEAMPEGLRREVHEHRERVRAESPAGLRDYDSDEGDPCIWLAADGTCKHYEYRPQVCRDFEVGGEDCRRFRRKQGIGRGP